MSGNGLKEAITGLGGSLCGVAVSYPLDVVKTRMQVQNQKSGDAYSGIIDGFMKIIQKEGLLSLYNGIESEAIRTSIMNFIYFWVYSYLKNNLLARQKQAIIKAIEDKSAVAGGKPAPAVESKEAADAPVTPASPAAPKEAKKEEKSRIGFWENIIIGVLAGCAAQAFVNPISVVQTRIQAMPANDNPGLLTMFGRVFAEGGISALYRGIGPALILTINPSIQNLVFDQLKFFWLRYRQSIADEEAAKNKTERKELQLSAVETFVLGALAKIAATVVTYPYIMAKVRLQHKPYNPKAADQMHEYKNALDCIWKVCYTDGLFGLYQGMSAQLAKSVIGSALMYTAKEKFEQLINTFLAEKQKEKGAASDGSKAAASK